MAFTPQQLSDLVVSTLEHVDKLKWTDIAFSRQQYHALPQILKKNKATIDDGDTIQWPIRFANNTNAKNTGLYDVDNVNVNDSLIMASIPWRFSTTSYAFDAREPALQRGPSKLVDIIKKRRADALGAMAELMETNVFVGATSSTDTKTPYGFKYWLVPNVTTSAGAFNGGNMSGFSSGPAGLSCDTYSGWKHWTAQYTSATADDLVRRMRKAYDFIQFQAPIDIPELVKGTDASYVIYMPYAVKTLIDEIGTTQNENDGRDIAAWDGKMIFRGCPMRWAPILDDTTYFAEACSPVLFINWNVFEPVVHNGWYMKETVKPAPQQHTVTEVHIDCTWNLRVKDRRRLATITKQAAWL